MPELTFTITGARATPFAASPQIALELSITNADPEERIQAVLLRAQVRIDAQRRTYSPEERARLTDVFGESDLFARTVKSVLWTHASHVVPPFVGSMTVDLALPCSFDMHVASARLLFALDDATDIPLSLLFSGTVFHHAREDSPLAVVQIPWTKEASYALPAKVYREAIDAAFPNGAFVPLRRDVFERLLRQKSETKSVTWEETIEALLAKRNGGA